MIQLHGWPPIYKIKEMIIYLAKEHIVTPVSSSSGDDVKDRTQYHTGHELQWEMDAASGVVTIE